MENSQKLKSPSKISNGNRSISLKLPALLLASCGLAGSLLQGAVVTQLRSVASDEDWNDATTTGGDIWSDGLSASSGNDYVNAGYSLRTKKTSGSTFGGGSLTLQTGGSLLLKASASNFTHTVNNLILDGGSIANGESSRNINLAGAITLISDSTYAGAGSGARTTTFTASISGSSVFNVNLGDTDTLTISSNSNTFSGEWLLSQSDSGSTSDFFATGNGALGNADVTIGSGIRFNADYDINNSAKSLVLDGIMTLDQDHTFGIVQINGDTLAAGTYSFTDLNTSYDAFFTDGGTGTLTVVPESSAFALLSGMLALTWVALGRRCVQ